MDRSSAAPVQQKDSGGPAATRATDVAADARVPVHPPPAGAMAPRYSPAQVLALQRRLGNRAVQRLLAGPARPQDGPATPTPVQRVPVAAVPVRQHAPTGRVQRAVGDMLAVRDPVLIRKHGVQGRISMRQVDGNYFVKTGSDFSFNELDGTYTPQELDYVPDFDYRGRDVKPQVDEDEAMGASVQHGGPQGAPLTQPGTGAQSSGRLDSEDESDDDFVIGPRETAQLGHDAGYDDGWADALEQRREGATFGQSAGRGEWKKAGYENGYRRGYVQGYGEGREAAKETGFAAYGRSERAELEKDVALLTGKKRKPPARDEQESAERKAQAKQYFEEFVTRRKLVSTEEIVRLLPFIQEHFGLSATSYAVNGDQLSIAYYASPPDYSHLVAYGPDPKDEEKHPATAFTESSAALRSLDKDAGAATPLGAIMSQLGLKTSEVDLLVKGDLEKADRPKRVQATVVGARRQSSMRVGGAVPPAAIAHLGHHEHMTLSGAPEARESFYDGGHLVGDQLMPSKGPDTFVEWNLAPMEQVLNQQSYLTFVENVIAAGAEQTGKSKTSVQISMIVSVYYPDQEYSVTEDDLAKRGLIPNTGGVPNSGKNRTVKIPSRVPYKWVLDAQITDAAHSFKQKVGTPGAKSKEGNTAYPYFNYSDLSTKEIPHSERHWWMLKGASKDAKGVITASAASKQLHFEAYQFYPAR